MTENTAEIGLAVDITTVKDDFPRIDAILIIDLCIIAWCTVVPGDTPGVSILAFPIAGFDTNCTVVGAISESGRGII